MAGSKAASDKRLREALVTALLAASRPAEQALISGKLAGQILDRWDELARAFDESVAVGVEPSA